MARGNGTEGSGGERRVLPTRPSADAHATSFEMGGLLVTVLPGGGVALMESHADGATSVITLDGRKLDALLERLCPGHAHAEEGPGMGDRRLPSHRPDRPDHTGDPPGGIAPFEQGAPNEVEEASDWRAYDEELKAAFLLEQYAGGVEVTSLPPGWEAILEDLPAALAARSRRTRARLQREGGRPRENDSGEE